VDQSVEVNRVIDNTLEMLRNNRQFRSRPVHIERQFTENLWIYIDSHQLQQVLWNLLLNAVEEMRDDGRLAIATSVRLGKHSGNSRENLAEISITDTGPGISPEHQSKIFDPFFTTKETGTGLGLTIVHRIVENYGGKIFVRSDGRHGTTFTLYFPLVEGGPGDTSG
jgi:signal transduction histidine kinase